MKLHVLATIALFFSPTNCFILQKVGESLHKITNAIIPHEHHHHHHEHCGHHHDPNYDEAIGSNSPTDTREQYDYRRPIPKQPPHSYPDRPYYNPDERPHRKPFNRPNSGYDKDNEVQVTTIKNLVLVDETTTSVEGAEGWLKWTFCLFTNDCIR